MDAGARPDAFGRRRPPAAPRTGVPYRHATRVLRLDPHRPPKRWCIGPPGRPPLEAVVRSWRARVAVALAESAYFIIWYVLIVGYFYLRSPWSGYLWILLVFTAWTVLWRWWDDYPQLSRLSPPVVAGADWMGVGRGRGAKWLPMYELSRIHARTPRYRTGEPMTGVVELVLTAPGHDEMALDLAFLQVNPALWDLVYQGVKSSIVAGAEVTDQAREALQKATRPVKPRSLQTRTEKLLNRAGALAEKGRTDRAVRTYDKLVTRYDTDPDADTRRVVALAVFAKAHALALEERFAEALTACDVALARYGDTSEPELRARVGETLANRAACLSGLGRSGEAVAAYDEAIAFLLAAEASRADYLGALLNRSHELVSLGRHEEALAGYQKIVAGYRDAPDPGVRHSLQAAQLGIAHLLDQLLERTDEALIAYEGMIAEHRDDPSAESRGLVSWAMLFQGMTLAQLGRHGEALASYERLIDDHFRAAHEFAREETTPMTFEQHYSALLHKARALAELGRHEEALDDYRSVADMYRRELREPWRDQAAAALRESGALLAGLGRMEEAVAAYDAVAELPAALIGKPSIWAVRNRRS